MNALWFFFGGVTLMFLLVFAVLPLVLVGLLYLGAGLFILGFIYGFIKGIIDFCKSKRIKPKTIRVEDDFEKILNDNGYKA